MPLPPPPSPLPPTKKAGKKPHHLLQALRAHPDSTEGNITPGPAAQRQQAASPVGYDPAEGGPWVTTGRRVGRRHGGGRLRRCGRQRAGGLHDGRATRNSTVQTPSSTSSCGVVPPSSLPPPHGKRTPCCFYPHTPPSPRVAPPPSPSHGRVRHVSSRCRSLLAANPAGRGHRGGGACLEVCERPPYESTVPPPSSLKL